MEQTTREVQVTIHADEKDQVFMHCPQCGATKKLSATLCRSIDQAEGIKVQCETCDYKYKILINYRKFYRKQTNLKGIYTNASDNDDQPFDFDTTEVITVGNISKTGIGFRMQNPINIEVNDVLKVRFILDNKKRSMIEKKAIVKRIDKDYIGAEFIKPINYQDKELAFYLMRQ